MYFCLSKKTFYTAMRDIGLLLLRIGMGAAMAYGHGYGKVLKIFKGDMGFLDPIGIGQAPSLVLAALAEFVFPILVIIGFKTRIATIPVIFTMFLAFFVVHATDPFSSKEIALLYLIGFASIALVGSGKYSIDRS